MNGWMNSTGHRDNILSTNNWEIGVGYATGEWIGPYDRYWTQDFGRRRNVYPLIINRDAASTDSRNVSLYIYGSFQQMRLKNDNGTWSDWQTFQNNVTWTIANGVGTHTVTAELKTGSTRGHQQRYDLFDRGRRPAAGRSARQRDLPVQHPAGQTHTGNSRLSHRSM